MRGTVDEVGRVAAPRASTSTCAKGGTISLARTAAQLRRAPRPRWPTPGLGLGDATCALLDAAEARARASARPACCGATYTPDCAAIHPARLVRGLAEASSAAAVTIYEQHPRAPRSSPAGSSPTDGEVRAEHVVRATEGYTPTLRRRSGARSCPSTR